ncbi:hypothetical protein Salat_1824500 [Sesamum alatum]|uniref:Pectinesterase inhibitor domain-containing protein n=1 Tax=Sesamum alatum TaxID=300844 RepID=A0AAE1Y2S2_9LAMI|nr:hypothetical protein Salat_1824500 [Sesamum alatum]
MESNAPAPEEIPQGSQAPPLSQEQPSGGAQAPQKGGRQRAPEPPVARSATQHRFCFWPFTNPMQLPMIGPSVVPKDFKQPCVHVNNRGRSAKPSRRKPVRDRSLIDAATTSAKISDALKNTTQLYAVQCLQDCSDDYDQSIDILKSVNFSVMNHYNYVALSVDVSGADILVSDCEDCFTERPGTLPSPITQENLSMLNIIRTILNIISLKECNKAESCLLF